MRCGDEEELAEWKACAGVSGVKHRIECIQTAMLGACVGLSGMSAEG